MSHYTPLITSEHRGAPNFGKVVDLLTHPSADIQAQELRLPTDLSLDFAVGVQLDQVGEWVGLKRGIGLPVFARYFSFDISGLGFDEGEWQGPYSSPEILISLEDEVYRSLLRVKIGANHWDTSIQQLEIILRSLKPGLEVYAVDGQDMSYKVYFLGTAADPIVRAVVLSNQMSIKPSGVRVNYFKTSVDNAPLFGFDIQTGKVGGFDGGAWVIKF
jgi:Protein of unknown function (DUF2612)